MDNCSKVLVIAAVATAGVLVYKSQKKKKITEPYKDVFMAKDIPNDEFIARPNFEAQLAPRFDPMRNGMYNKLNGYLPNISQQASPVNPLGNGSFPVNAGTVDYAAMGNSAEIAEASADCAFAKLKKYDAVNPTQNSGGSQVSEKFSMNFSGSNGLKKSSPAQPNALEYLNPQDMLPEPDLTSVLSKNPVDPDVFMYDRTLFAPLKRRNINNVDFIRGDIPIAMVKRGYFDVAANPNLDLIQSNLFISPDLESKVEMQDLVYTRYDHEYPLQSTVTSGDMENRFM